MLDAWPSTIEERCYQVLALQQPMASDLRAIVTAIRLTSEIERSGDLMVNIARGPPHLRRRVRSRAPRAASSRMSEEATRLFRLAIDAYAEGNAALAAALDDMDDRLDQPPQGLHPGDLRATTPTASTCRPAVQLALIGRYYERIGDHAVNIGERVQYMVTGWLPEHTRRGARGCAARTRRDLTVTPAWRRRGAWCSPPTPRRSVVRRAGAPGRRRLAGGAGRRPVRRRRARVGAGARPRPTVGRLERRSVDRGAAVERAATGLDRPTTAAGRVRLEPPCPQGVVVVDEHGGEVVFRNTRRRASPAPATATPSSRRPIDELVAAALAGGPTQPRTLDLFGPPRRTLVIDAVPLLERRPPASGRSCVIDDVTERRRLEAVRRDFVANISHELKTPVGALGLLAETLLGRGRPRGRPAAGRAHADEAFRVGRTIEDLLELSAASRPSEEAGATSRAGAPRGRRGGRPRPARRRARAASPSTSRAGPAARGRWATAASSCRRSPTCSTTR